MRSLARPPTSASTKPQPQTHSSRLLRSEELPAKISRPRPKRRYITFQFFAFHGGRWHIIRSVIMTDHALLGHVLINAQIGCPLSKERQPKCKLTRERI